MTEAIVAIEHWGDNLGLRLPAAVARAAHLDAGQQVRITAEDGRVVITRIVRERLSLEQRLAGYDPARHGGEAMANPSVGAERC